MSNGLGKNILKSEAKKAYKTGSKGVAKKNRMPFNQFFKKFCEMKQVESQKEPEQTEDFDLSQVANINSDLQVETVSTAEKIEEKT